MSLTESAVATNGSKKRGKGRKRSPRPPKPHYTAKTADKHVLYQESVQCPEADVVFFDRVYRNTYGGKPTQLREDFCGTSLLCAEWVRTRKDNRAVGVDLDPKVLEWGRVHNIEPLGDDARRVELIEGNVLEAHGPKVQIVCALNFSYFGFKTRPQLIEYFSAVRKSLRDDGLFVLDIMGGPDAQVLQEEEKEQEGFDYVWDQDAFNPITHEFKCYIHFNFPDGSKMRKAFRYDWRLWSVAEVCDALREVGFSKADVYWEGDDGDGEGNGVFRLSTKGDNSEAFISYIVGTP